MAHSSTSQRPQIRTDSRRLFADAVNRNSRPTVIHSQGSFLCRPTHFIHRELTMPQTCKACY